MKNKKILIVGGTGSFGSALAHKLLEMGVSQIRIFARNEAKMVEIKRTLSDKRVESVLGDVRDKERLLEASRDCDIIFHLAALKHISICETAPNEAILTNVIGTENIIDCANANKVAKVIYISSNKAVNANCTYGCTKLLGEKLILAANQNSIFTKFIVFRGGNLLASEGSVIPLFKKQINEKHIISLTDKNMNRFFINIPKACELLIESAIRGAGGEIFLARMSSLWIYDIAKFLAYKYGLDESVIVVSGLRPGEKITECLAMEEETNHIYCVNDELYVIETEDRHSWIKNGFIKKDNNFLYHSQDAIISYEKTVEFLKAANI